MSAIILEACERETIINRTDEDDCWNLYTAQKPMMTQMERIGLKPTKVEKDEDGNIVGCFYELPLDQLLLRKKRKKVEYSEERRQQLKEHMLNVIENRDNKE